MCGKYFAHRAIFPVLPDFNSHVPLFHFFPSETLSEIVSLLAKAQLPLLILVVVVVVVVLQVICAPQSNKTACNVDQTLQDTKHHMYQLVYIASMVSVLMFGIIKGFTFTNTTLMASSSLHNRVFNKVVAQSVVGPPDGSVHRAKQALILCQTLCQTPGTGQISWSLLSSFQGRLLLV